MKRKSAMLILPVLLMAALSACGGSNEAVSGKGTVYIYALGDYIDPELLYEFEDKTGYHAIMDSSDTNEEMYPVIKNGSAHYDLICVSDYMIERLISEGLLQEYDAENIENLDNIMDEIKPFIESFDPGMKYSIPHTWGTYGLLYNPELLEGMGMSAADLTSWEGALWNEKASGQIIMPNSIREAYMIAAKTLGYSINESDPTKIDEMSEKLIEQKPLVYRYDNDGVRDYLINESAAIGVVNSGEVYYSKEYNEKLEYIVPDEGTEVWTDCWALTSSAEGEGKAAAEAWMNFMLEKESAEKNFEYLTYAIPNKEIKELLDNDILSPSAELLSKSDTLKSLGAETDSLYSEGWKSVKG